MPTITQLPPGGEVTAADILPLSQAGTTNGVSVGALLAGTQPAILAQSSTLLGRVSVGPGGPEEIDVGLGLVPVADTLVATGADHASFSQQETFVSTDAVVLSSGGKPALLPVDALRQLFSPGSNISITSSGIISSTADIQVEGANSSGYAIDELPTISTLAGQDLVGVSQNGSNYAIALADLLDGETIDGVQPAGPASDSDAFWVAQGGSTMCRQTLSATWPWIVKKLPAYIRPIVEITESTVLDTAVHNGRILLCINPITLSPPSSYVAAFICDVINLSSGNITLASGITTSSGQAVLTAGQCMKIYATMYSGGSLVYGWMGGSASSAAPPGQVTNLSSSGQTANSVSLAWAAPASGGAVAGYAVSFRVSGSVNWIAAAMTPATQCTITSLAGSTTYDFIVAAINGSLAGVSSSIITAQTGATTSAISAPTGLSVSNVTAASVTLNWSAPIIGIAQSYTVYYRPTGSSVWTGSTTGVTNTFLTTVGLSGGQSYDWQIVAIGPNGSTATSSVIVAVTSQAMASVTSITWNVVPSGPFVHGTGVLGMNAHISPSTAAVQFGVSMSMTVPPAIWTSGNYVNTDLWGAYVPTPSIPGTWYAWVEGLDGSAPTVYTVGLVVT
ncbi:MAG: fibronectin type III domain-containing protein [Bradyrhizobium sp.]|nr:fibronectin type III domain-containing protein [Bradyrhizobium sp.]